VQRGATRRRSNLVVLLAVLLLVSVNASLAQSDVATPAASTPVAGSAVPDPITFPEDDGPHAAFIEWWYYTGHLFTESGARYGFEFVVFKGEQNGAVAGYASHFAITDNERGTFQYDQQFVLAAGIATPPPTEHGFDLRVGDWRMWGRSGSDRLVASLADYAVALSLEPTKPATLHDDDGYIAYDSSEYTYYYSRTRLDITGTLRVDGLSLPVTGEAWMDHQWGYFTTFNGTGWDWYALQLSDGTDVMLYVVPTQGSRPATLDGSVVAPNGDVTVLDGGDYTITPIGSWTSPETGVSYPSGWSIEIPGEDIDLTVTPTIPDQEIDSSTTTGVIYWEGEVEVDGSHAGESVTGLGYVELTGHDKRSG
jgi:predicted secreted hydrolase